MTASLLLPLHYASASASTFGKQTQRAEVRAEERAAEGRSATTSARGRGAAHGVAIARESRRLRCDTSPCPTSSDGGPDRAGRGHAPCLPHPSHVLAARPSRHQNLVCPQSLHWPSGCDNGTPLRAPLCVAQVRLGSGPVGPQGGRRRCVSARPSPLSNHS
jgi:hypothetical protein